MPDPAWYYAIDERQLGPVTGAELKTLAGDGKLHPHDLVWKEGMADWAAAREVKGLFTAEQLASAQAPAPQPPPVEDAPAPAADSNAAASPAPTSEQPVVHVERRRAPSAGVASRPLEALRPFGQPMLLAGLVLVLLARGCDTISHRYADRLEAKSEVAERQFQDDWDQRRLEIERQQEALREQDEPLDAADRRRLDSLDDRLAALNEQMRERRQELQRGEWRDLQIAARDADAGRRLWGPWRETLFVLGAIVLSLGLLIVGTGGEGAERWICLVMLAIITFSIFIGGVAWIGALPVGL